MRDLLTQRAQGKLIVFEGPDAAGKTTLIQAVARSLEQHGIAHESHAFPGNEPGTLGELVYRLHHDALAAGIRQITPTALQALHISAHLDAIERTILPALRAGRVVLLDRYWWSTWCYGVVGGADLDALEALVAVERHAWADWVPTALVLPQRPSEAPERLKLADAYSILVEKYKAEHPVITVDTSGAPSAAVSELMSKLPALWPKHTERRQRVSRTGSAHGQGVSVTRATFSALSPAKTTIVYDTYWRLAADRQQIFFKRLKGDPPPWTSDPILAVHKFTNAYRASDRVSQYLLRSVIYSKPYEARDIFFRVLLFKLFNRIDTWETLCRELGDVTFETYDYRRYDRVLEAARARGQKIYSAAYIMPSAGRVFGVERKHQAHLLLLDRMVRDELWKKLQDARSMSAAFQLLLTYPSIGEFLAYQYIIDLNYSPLLDFSENDFVMPGPGALDGISKCFTDRGGLSEADIIKVVCDRQAEEFSRLGIDFSSLWGRPLHLIDCQNLFCEVSKYSRVRHPEVEGVAGRTRIKQMFTPTDGEIDPMYPPKWGLDGLIAQWSTANRRRTPTLFSSLPRSSRELAVRGAK